MLGAHRARLEGSVPRVGVLVDVTELEPIQAMRGACAMLTHLRWSRPSARTVAARQFAFWEAASRTSHGCVRIEMRAGPGLAPIAERQRPEMLADPQLAHLHHILRMPWLNHRMKS
jgi:hypothetical protein